MSFLFRRYLSLSLRSRRWLIFAVCGVLMFVLASAIAAFIVLVLTPANFETIRSFHPAALGLTCFTFLMIGVFWFFKGLRSAFQTLSLRDHEASERLRAIVFRKGAPPVLPSLVALGGGTGLSSLLKGLKEFPINLTAIVTVTDDGGSSGRLRKDLQILPPGDIRNCLVALSASESLLSRLFQFRFQEAGEIGGHSFGNLFIAAMTEVLGDFGSAVHEASNILAIKGRVIPVTCENVQLRAKFSDQSEQVGESAISGAGKKITEITLFPQNPLANPGALNAIDEADLIALGPGSLFTSIIPNLLVPDIAERINRSKARVVFICNVMTQPGETDQFSALDHVDSILARTPLKRIDVVVVNSRRAARPLMAKYEAQKQFWVPPTVTRIEARGMKVITGDFLSETDLVRHDPIALAQALITLISQQVSKAV